MSTKLKITDCIWELENIGKSTSEITFGATINEEDVLQINKIESDYIVAKVNSGSYSNLSTLYENRFNFIEDLIEFRFNLHERKEFVKKYESKISKIGFKKVEDLGAFFSNWRENNLFNTDRIALDPNLGIEKSNIRYKNWIKNSLKKDDFSLNEIIFDNKNVGFIFGSTEGDYFHYTIAGIYKAHQGKGYGSLIGLIPIKYCIDNKIENTIVRASSNNTAILKIYTRIGFVIEKIEHVLIRHN